MPIPHRCTPFDLSTALALIRAEANIEVWGAPQITLKTNITTTPQPRKVMYPMPVQVLTRSIAPSDNPKREQ
jgi:hypothetical protein